MLKSYLLFIILFLGFIVNAQQKLHFGNDALERGKYPKAIRLLTKAYNRRQTFEAASKLGRAYELIQDFSKSEEWYRKSVNMPQAQDSIYPYFANILRMNSKFDEAKMFYEMLDKPNDEKAVIWKEYIESCSRADTMLFQNTSAKVYTIANINDSASDFPSYARGKNLYFASSRRSTKPAYKIINPETDFPYYSVYHAEVRKNEAKEIKNVLTDKEYSSHEGPVALSRDYIAYLTVNSNLSERRLINRRLDIQIGKVNSSSDKITELVPFPYNTIEYSEGQAYLSNDGKRLYFVSNGPLSLGGTDIFMCLKKAEFFNPNFD